MKKYLLLAVSLLIGMGVQAQGRHKLAVTTTTAPGGVVGASYSLQLTATGGKTPYTWAVTGGTLPPGLTLSSSGLISGAPTTVGTFNFTVTVTDSSGSSASLQIKTKQT